jgi:murein DD-endopeptidase MepM/ murein hydrolase activator NlpD
MSGVVFKIENSINDNVPYSGNYPYNTDNTIVIRNDRRYILLGHLKMGSIRVDVGDVVGENDWLAEAGNSGYSERSHIHVQLIESDSENFWKGM